MLRRAIEVSLAPIAGTHKQDKLITDESESYANHTSLFLICSQDHDIQSAVNYASRLLLLPSSGKTDLQTILKNEYNNVSKILEDNKNILSDLTNRLLDKKRMNKASVERFFRNRAK